MENRSKFERLNEENIKRDLSVTTEAARRPRVTQSTVVRDRETGQERQRGKKEGEGEVDYAQHPNLHP